MPRALHVLLLIILMSASNSTIYARDILPSLGVGLGTGVVDKDPGFHFEIKPGVLFIAEVGDFSSICFLPTIGLQTSNQNGATRNLFSAGATVMYSNEIDLGITADFLHGKTQNGYRIGGRIGFFHIGALEIAYQNQTVEELQFIFIGDFPAFFFQIF